MEYLSSWISPGAVFFLFVNVLIGAIVVTSRGQQGGRAASTRRLCRSASSMVLDRLRSFSMLSFQFQPSSLEECYHTSLELEADEQQQQPEPSAIAEPPSAPAAADEPSERAKEEGEAGGDESITSSDKTDGPSSLQGDAEQSPSSGDAAVAAAEATAAVAESQAKVAGATAVPMQRARACRQEALEGKATLNARAELFIRQFKEDLKLQRLNSIMNYTRALRRGAGAAPATEHQ
ncbi:hypothetical protein BS78_07G128300 [Paspalum vaginatum]|nr:hypothetical protein BS78_07G128300 [Paspalum vaginatum]